MEKMQTDGRWLRFVLIAITLGIVLGVVATFLARF
jgi:hypothetical protein